jgi:hypothetical protein
MNDTEVLTFTCGSSVYNSSDASVTNFLDVSDIAFTLASSIAMVVSAIFLAIVLIGVKRKQYMWKHYVLTANRNISDIIFAFVIFLHFETRMMDHESTPNMLKHMFTVPGASLIGPKLLHFIFTFNFLMVLTISSFSSIVAAYALKQPKNYDDKITTGFLCKISWLMWILIGIISFLVTIPDNHATMAEKTTAHMAVPDARPNLDQIAFFCDPFDKEEIGIIEDTTAALILPLMCYLIAGSSFFILMVVLCSRRLNTIISTEMSSAACRLGIQFGIALTYLFVYLYAYSESFDARAICTRGKTICDVLNNVHIMRSYIGRSIAATVAWLIRMIADPIVDLVGDKRLRKTFQRRETQFDDLVEMLEQNQDETEFTGRELS